MNEEVRAPIPAYREQLIDTTTALSEIDVMIYGFMDTLEITYEEAQQLAIEQQEAISVQQKQMRYTEQIERCKREQKIREDLQKKALQDILEESARLRDEALVNFRKELFGKLRFFEPAIQSLLRPLLTETTCVLLSESEFQTLSSVLEKLTGCRPLQKDFAYKLLNVYTTTVQFVPSEEDE